MRSVFLPIALVAALAACESDGRGGGLFGSSRDSGVYSGSSTAAATSSERRAIARECDPRNVPPEQRATVLHQDRPGGSSCPENVIDDRRGRR
jgi:hypothetical protein